MNRKTLSEIIAVLKESYLKPDTKLNFLDFDNPFQILIMTVLSAQTTDNNVNKVKPQLFSKYPDCKALAAADQEDVEEIIRSTGFYHAKAKNIIAASKMLRDDFDSEVPRTIEELTKLPGVGRKTANIVLSHAYDINDGIAVDTHVKRLAGRLGMTESTDPVIIERDLMKLVPKEDWRLINFLLISHGRTVCDAKKPLCDECKLKGLCREFKTGKKNKN
ncbi:MAG: endonuclease III [Methanomicrobium sp.]|nr:endonuclease III [Methanomicrobium sp.]